MKRGIFCRMRPVSGSNSCSDSISSSNSSMRIASSLCSAGKTSMVSPRTRNVPREKSCSLRVYCMRISWPIMSRWPILSPTRMMKRICV